MARAYTRCCATTWTAPAASPCRWRSTRLRTAAPTQPNPANHPMAGAASAPALHDSSAVCPFPYPGVLCQPSVLLLLPSKVCSHTAMLWHCAPSQGDGLDMPRHKSASEEHTFGSGPSGSRAQDWDPSQPQPSPYLLPRLCRPSKENAQALSKVLADSDPASLQEWT